MGKTYNEINEMESKDLYLAIRKRELELSKLNQRILELQNELVPYYHIQTLRTSTRSEKDRWEREIKEVKK